MSQYDFDELLQKYLAGTCDPAEEKLILDWYQDAIAHRTEPVDTRDKAVIQERIWQKLATNTIQKGMPRRSKLPYVYAAAASLIVLVTVGAWLFTTKTTVTPTAHLSPSRGSIELKNISSKTQQITLEDGSRITLKPGGIVSYPEHFGRQNRTVYLKGEAFFNVKRDPTKPFIVHTGELITEVLGTSFTIKSYQGAKDIEVSVATGRVSVYQAVDKALRSSKEVILKPNERITYTTHSKQLIPTLVESPVRLLPANQPASLQFDATPLPDVLARLQAVYGIDIFLESDGLSACVLNADLTELSLYDQLELVCRSVDALYEVRGTSIFIKATGSGCQ